MTQMGHYDQLAMRIVELDRNDELYNVTHQLVTAVNRFISDEDTGYDLPECECPFCDVRRAMKPFKVAP